MRCFASPGRMNRICSPSRCRSSRSLSPSKWPPRSLRSTRQKPPQRGRWVFSTLHDAPKANRSFEDVMPLIPGVLRGPSGEINMSGARASAERHGAQRSGCHRTRSPRTTQINLPTETVSNVQVLTSPYDTQYGGFAGAVSTVETKAL